MFNGLSAEDISSMPAFPFPKELFPPGTFPPGVQFAAEGANMLPPSVRELVEAGQAGNLGAMFEASFEELEPGVDSLFSLLMGGSSFGVKHGSKKRSKRSKAHQYAPPPSGAFPPGFDVNRGNDMLELLSACSEQELMEKLMRGELQQGLIGMAELSHIGSGSCSQSCSDSENSDTDSESSAYGSDEAAGLLSHRGGEHREATRDWSGGHPSEHHPAGESLPIVLIQELGAVDALGLGTSCKGAQGSCTVQCTLFCIHTSTGSMLLSVWPIMSVHGRPWRRCCTKSLKMLL
jgi:hypothetical protein